MCVNATTSLWSTSMNLLQNPLAGTFCTFYTNLRAAVTSHTFSIMLLAQIKREMNSQVEVKED